MPSLLIVYTSVSVRVLPRNGWLHAHEPSKKFIAEKSGCGTGTGVGAAAVVIWAIETAGAPESPMAKSAHASAEKTKCFISENPFAGDCTKLPYLGRSPSSLLPPRVTLSYAGCPPQGRALAATAPESRAGRRPQPRGSQRCAG